MHIRRNLFHRRVVPMIVSAVTLTLIGGVTHAGPFFFSTGNPDGRIATASRPDTPAKPEIESADDFILTSSLTTLTSATFTGLLTGTPASIGEVRVEIYRVFPKDSAVPPSGNVPTRTNSPSDVEFVDRDTASSNLTFTTAVLSSSFTAANSVLNGINQAPNQTTGGEGAVTGEEIQFTVTFTTPINLAADHYFFIPQVEVTGGEFYWLSAPKPIVAPGTPFAPDLQSWIRNDRLDPDWLRVGTDIVGGSPAPTFNAAFSLTGSVPEPGTLLLIGAGMTALWWRRKRIA
jgi:PEP-CTERM motif